MNIENINTWLASLILLLYDVASSGCNQTMLLDILSHFKFRIWCEMGLPMSYHFCLIHDVTLVSKLYTLY